MFLKDIRLFEAKIRKLQYAFCSHVFILFFYFFLFTANCFSQSNPFKISTLSSAIGSSTFLQSIGQSSVVTGTSTAGGYVIRQGFLQPTSRIEIRSIEPVSIISLDVFPNPFNSKLSLKLSHTSASVSQIELYSNDGLRVWSSEIGSNLSEIQLHDFDGLHTGKYILRLVIGNQVITKQLIKN